MSWEPGPGWLFCPADRPERYAKAFDRADVVILDLEDAVAPSAKATARQALREATLPADRTVVRINAASTEEHAADLELVRGLGLPVMLAKTESAADLDAIGVPATVALVESPAGAVGLQEIVGASSVAAVMWGADDLVAGLGGTSSRWPDGGFRDVARHVRVQALLAAKTRGLLALDAVHMDIADLDGLRRACEDGAACGFDATVAIHPSQVPVIRAAYLPSAERVDWARRLLAEAGEDRGVFTFEGRMVDGPVFAQAERTLRLADRA